jgi:hypothetical protein
MKSKVGSLRGMVLAGQKNAQQSVYLTLGTLRTSQAVSTPYHFSVWTASPGPRERAGNANRWAPSSK